MRSVATITSRSPRSYRLPDLAAGQERQIGDGGGRHAVKVAAAQDAPGRPRESIRNVRGRVVAAAGIGLAAALCAPGAAQDGRGPGWPAAPSFPPPTRGTATSRARPFTRAPTPTCAASAPPTCTRTSCRARRRPDHGRAPGPAPGADPLHRLRRRERPRPVPVPPRTGRGRVGPPRGRRAARDVPPVRALRRPPLGRRVGRGQRGHLEPALGPPAPRGLDLRRRGRPADPAGPGARRRGAGRDRSATRCA